MTAGDHGSTIKHVGNEDKKQNSATLEFPHYKRVGNYLLGSRIGEGSFAKVYVGLHSPTGEKVAIKVINKEQAKHDGYVFRNLHREGKILQVLRHPNILQVFDILETCNNYYLITELCSGGDLIDIVAEKGPLSENVVRSYVWKVANAVAYMHERKVIHRDLKVENLLFDSDGNLKVIDFGLSNALPNPTDNKSLGFLSTQCGSPAYAAPELLSKRPYGPKVDVWSIGVITYALLVGKLPFTVEPFHVQKLCRKMLRSEMNPFPPNISHHCRHFIRTLLQPSTIKRPSINEVLKMKWFAFQPLELKRNSLKPSLIRRHSPCAQAKTTTPHILAPSASTSNFLTASRSMDVDAEVVREMTDQYDYDETSIQYCVQKNRPGPILTTYHLLLQRARNTPTTGRTMVSTAPMARKESVKKLDEERTRKLSTDVAATVTSPRAFQPHIYDNYITKMDGSAPNKETCTADPEIQGRAAAFKTMAAGGEKADGARSDFARKPNPPQSLLLNLPDAKQSDARKFCLKPAADDEGTHKFVVTPPAAAKMLYPLQNISQLSKPPTPASQMKSTTLPEIILPSKPSSKASMRTCNQQQQNEPDSINLLASLKLRPSQANKLKTQSKISESQLRLKPGTRESTDNFTSPSKSHKNQQQRMRKRSFTETIAATLSFLKSTTGSRNNSNNNRRT